ncbi:unnamed protein product [Trifolium pratense]|uniref:Uncharacterized protein n=1 Tax=Trifolium pratense TaxID=57577 RepID=A0ACB0M1K9_TRIPR|nr:unnamed protein product [Trifolium pratense]
MLACLENSRGKRMQDNLTSSIWWCFKEQEATATQGDCSHLRRRRQFMHLEVAQNPLSKVAPLQSSWDLTGAAEFVLFSLLCGKFSALLDYNISRCFTGVCGCQ